MIKCPRCGDSGTMVKLENTPLSLGRNEYRCGVCGFTWDDKNFIIPQTSENKNCGEVRADTKTELKQEIFNFCKKVMNDDDPQPYMIKVLPAMINNLIMLLE